MDSPTPGMNSPSFNADTPDLNFDLSTPEVVHFPILKLPWLVIFEVLKVSNLHDLIQFSFISQRSRRIVKLIRNKFTGISVQLEKNQVIFRIKSKDGFLAGWFLESGWLDEHPAISRRCIEGHWMQIYTSNYILSVTTGDLCLTAKQVLEYLIDLFRLEVEFIYILADNIDCPDEILKLEIGKFKDLIIKGTVPMKNDQLASIIKETNAYNGIYLQIPIYPDFYIDPVHLNAKNLSLLQKSTWLRASMLFELTCTNIMIVDCAFNLEDCLQFIRRWYYSEDTKFEWMYLTKVRKSQRMNFQESDFVEWSEERRGPYYKFFCDTIIDCRHGWDLQRRDGALATLLIRGELLFFGVWHERFPDVNGRRFV